MGLKEQTTTQTKPKKPFVVHTEVPYTFPTRLKFVLGCYEDFNFNFVVIRTVGP